MKLISKGNDTFTIELSEEELILLSNGLNETLEAVEDPEFHTRTGGTPDEAKSLIAQIKEFLT